MSNFFDESAVGLLGCCAVKTVVCPYFLIELHHHHHQP